MQDFLIDNDYEVRVADGDFVTGNSDQQHQTHLLMFDKGAFKQHPTACVGAQNYLEAEDEGELLREINIQFAGDGMEVKSLKIENGVLNVAAIYK